MIERLCTMLCGLVSAAVLSLVAQEPSALRDAYKPVMENDWVRVERVHYAPNVKLPAHPHTEFAAAYVYLNDSGPVTFGHAGVSYGAVTRQPTKAGMFRLYRAVKEMHTVENTSPLPSDFFRIEFRTEPAESALLRGRYERLPATSDKPVVQFDNAQLRVTRIAISDGIYEIKENAQYPSVIVDTHQRTVKWVATDVSYSVEVRGDKPSDMLRLELKTPPLRQLTSP